MKIIIRILLIFTAAFYLLMGILMLYLSSRIDDLAKDKKFITAGDENICIFASHQDDGVIMAGGYAAQTIKRGGSVNIVYIFDGETGNGRKRDIVRMNESFKAWGLGGG